jgi:IclR family KDG regulon transcriptional repressor
MKIQSIEKTIRIIELLSNSPSGLSLTEMSDALKYPPSTVHHIISTLMHHGYVNQASDTKKYSLGYAFLNISHRILENMDLRKVARKYLQELHQKSNETVHLAILREGRVIYIDKIQRPGSLSLATYVGFSTHPHAAAGGKVLLSQLSRDEVYEIYGSNRFPAYTKNTITDLERLMKELAHIRESGYAIDNEEYYEGIRCVATPIKNGRGGIVAALSITGSIFTMTKEKVEKELIELVITTGEGISSELR